MSVLDFAAGFGCGVLVSFAAATAMLMRWQRKHVPDLWDKP